MFEKVDRHTDEQQSHWYIIISSKGEQEMVENFEKLKCFVPLKGKIATQLVKIMVVPKIPYAPRLIGTKIDIGQENAHAE